MKNKSEREGKIQKKAAFFQKKLLINIKYFDEDYSTQQKYINKKKKKKKRKHLMIGFLKFLGEGMVVVVVLKRK